MKKTLLIICTTLALSGCTLPFVGKKQSALQVNASPQASVYLNGSHVGQTPYLDQNLKPGEYTVRVMVDNDPSKDWQTNITLNPKIVTVLQRNFGTTPEESSNYLLQLEPLPGKTDTQLSLITIPDNVIVKLDGQPQGFSPVALDTISAGDHTIVLAAPGYQELTIKAQTKTGYKLIVSAQLAKTPGLQAPAPESEATPSAQTSSTTTSPTPKPRSTPSTTPIGTSSAEIARPYVEITETGTGWLRVRSEPNSSADNEVAKLDIGVKVPWIEVNDTGWYKIEYSPGKQGWISAKYAKLYK